MDCMGECFGTVTPNQCGNCIDSNNLSLISAVWDGESVTLNWEYDSPSDFNGYAVVRNCEEIPISNNSSNTEYIDNPSPDQTYIYNIKVINDSNEEFYSNEIIVMTGSIIGCTDSSACNYNEEASIYAVSYTHLTLPTICSV